MTNRASSFLPKIWQLTKQPIHVQNIILGNVNDDGNYDGDVGEDNFDSDADYQPNFFTETAVTPEQKVKKWFPRWEINRHAEG